MIHDAVVIMTSQCFSQFSIIVHEMQNMYTSVCSRAVTNRTGQRTRLLYSTCNGMRNLDRKSKNPYHDTRCNKGMIPHIATPPGNETHKMPSTQPLQWRRNGRYSVSNHQPYDCLLNRLYRRRSKKTSKLRVTGVCVGNSPGTGEFPAQMANNAENVSIWWRHHVNYTLWYLPVHQYNFDNWKL